MNQLNMECRDGISADDITELRDGEFWPIRSPIMLTDVSPDDLWVLCGKVKGRGAPATTIYVRDIIKEIFGFAILHGDGVANPADEAGPASIATFVPKDRSLSPAEIRLVFTQLEHVPTLRHRVHSGCQTST